VKKVRVVKRAGSSRRKKKVIQKVGGLDASAEPTAKEPTDGAFEGLPEVSHGPDNESPFQVAAATSAPDAGDGQDGVESAILNLSPADDSEVQDPAAVQDYERKVDDSFAAERYGQAPIDIGIADNSTAGANLHGQFVDFALQQPADYDIPSGADSEKPAGTCSLPAFENLAVTADGQTDSTEDTETHQSKRTCWYAHCRPLILVCSFVRVFPKVYPPYIVSFNRVFNWKVSTNCLQSVCASIKSAVSL